MESVSTQELKNGLKEIIRNKLKPEVKVCKAKEQISNGDVSSFLVHVFSEDEIIASKVSHSMSTSLGMSFYEQACAFIAEKTGAQKVETQHKLRGNLSENLSSYLHSLLENDNYIPNRGEELKEVRKIALKDSEEMSREEDEYPDKTVDVYIKNKEGKEFYIDITTVKPNKKEFRTMKRKLLCWAYLRFREDTSLKVEDVNPYMAIPYNPESMEIEGIEYNRHSKYYDRKDLLVGNELWQLVSHGVIGIKDVVEVFKELGDEIKDKIKNL